MGITSFSLTLIEKYKGNSKSVIELGAQNLYNQPNLPAPYADEYYKSVGIEYDCIDLCKENGAIPLDLSQPQEITTQYDLVTDFGTAEHVSAPEGGHSTDAIYNCWNTKHKLLKQGGIMINENPKTGNWPGHGCNYVDMDFYNRLANINGYEILELGEHPAMGNTTDGWNIFCVLKKVNNNPFCSLEEFKTFGIKEA